MYLPIVLFESNSKLLLATIFIKVDEKFPWRVRVTCSKAVLVFLSIDAENGRSMRPPFFGCLNTPIGIMHKNTMLAHFLT